MSEMDNYHDELKEFSSKQANDYSSRRRPPKTPMVLYIVLGVAVVAIIILAALLLRNKSGDGGAGQTTTAETTSPAEETTTPVPEETGIDYSQYALEKDVYPEINTLMQTYYKAILDADMETLGTLVADVSVFSEDSLKKQSEYIENYDNISCYTAPGIEEGSYIVYVYYSTKFLNIETQAPALDRRYVDRNASGQLQINNAYSNEDLSGVLTQLTSSASVQELTAQVDNELAEAVAADENLNKLVTKLKEAAKSADDSTTAADETTEEAPEGTTEGDSTDDTTAAADDGSYSPVNHVAEAKENCNIRASASTDAEIVGKLAGGALIQRVGFNEEWSQVRYGTEGKIGYVASEYLTTTLTGVDGSDFKSINDVVIASENANIRKSPSTTGEVLGKLAGGNTIIRTGYNEEWSRVEYDGGTAYISNEVLQ